MNSIAHPSRLIFISYARADQEFVLSLANDLRNRGVEVWVDQWAIRDSADWDRAIDDALARSTCMLIVLTPESVASDEVRAELRAWLDLKKPIVPLLLRPCDVPRRLRLTQLVDMTSWSPDFSGGIERILRALNDAVDLGAEGTGVRPKKGTIETSLGKVHRWGSERPVYLLALGLPPLFFATWRLFRLPVAAETEQNFIFVLAGVLSSLLFWCRNRAGALFVAVAIGLAFVVKPALLPFVESGFQFPYSSATAMTYWGPGLLFLIAACCIALTAPWPRLVQDFNRLHPNIGAALVAAAAEVAAYLYYSRPTLYDIYQPFRPQYDDLRRRLVAVAASVDKVERPLSLSRPLDPPLILDERISGIRDEDPSTTGHLYLYQHLTDPDVDFGDTEYAIGSDLHLNLRDTGKHPLLGGSSFVQFASAFPTDSSASLTRAIAAPYLVIIKPLNIPACSTLYCSSGLPGPFKVFLYNLPEDEVVFATDTQDADTLEALKEKVNDLLKRNLGAKVLQ